jgi:hypothetical protein
VIKKENQPTENNQANELWIGQDFELGLVSQFLFGFDSKENFKPRDGDDDDHIALRIQTWD